MTGHIYSSGQVTTASHLYGTYFTPQSFTLTASMPSIIIYTTDGFNQKNATENMIIDNILDQIKIDPESQSNNFANNHVHVSESKISISEKIKLLMTENFGVQG